jgi:hypothetical protein
MIGRAKRLWSLTGRAPFKEEPNANPAMSAKHAINATNQRWPNMMV